jgi:hypothetical protein
VSGPRVRRREDVLWRRSLDAVLLLPAGATEPVTLVGSGPAVWELLAEPASVAELAQDLAARYATDTGTVEGDLVSLLDRLRELGVIEAVR